MKMQAYLSKEFCHFKRRGLASAVCSIDRNKVSPQNCPQVDRLFTDFAIGGDCGALSNFDGVTARWCTQADHLTAGDVGLIDIKSLRFYYRESLMLNPKQSRTILQCGHFVPKKMDGNEIQCNRVAVIVKILH